MYTAGVGVSTRDRVRGIERRVIARGLSAGGPAADGGYRVGRGGLLFCVLGNLVSICDLYGEGSVRVIGWVGTSVSGRGLGDGSGAGY
jgi:hypothetical protein